MSDLQPARAAKSIAKPKVAFVTSRFPFDGKEAFLHAELSELSKVCDLTIIPAASRMRGHASPHQGMHLAQQYAPFSLVTFVAAFRETARCPGQVFQTLREVASAPRNVRAKLLNVLIFPKALAVAGFLRETRVRHVHAYWLSTPSTIAYVSSRLNGVPWSASGHRWDIADSNVRTIGRPNAAFLRSAQFVRTVSSMGAKLVASALGAENCHKVTTLHLGVNLPQEQEDVTRVVPLGSRELRLACIASLVPVKGHTDLLAALEKVKLTGTAFRCTMFGEGPLRRRLARIVARRGLGESVTIAGRLSHVELLRKLREHEFDATILTSRDAGIRQCEGIPVALMESMAAGIPCIATRSGAVPELVNNANGILVDANDVDALANAIVCFARDHDLRRRLGEQARASIEADFFVERTAAQLAALILPASADAADDEASGLERFAPAAT